MTQVDRGSRYPARLHVLIAREAPSALVIRRGPARRVSTFSWDRSNDVVKLAQWMSGRIYERRCDLSPDGLHWIYFAMNGDWSGEARGAWTAVASAPWLKARVLLPKGDCWQGGGLFLDNRTYWVNGGGCHTRRQEAPWLVEDTSYAPPTWYGGECLTVYYNRLQRDGWTLTSLQAMQNPRRPTVFEKHLPKGWTLLKTCNISSRPRRGRGVYYDEHALVSEEGEFLAFPEWEWADWVDGSIIYAKGGGLFRLPLKSTREPGAPELIHDFNTYMFELRQAPY